MKEEPKKKEYNVYIDESGDEGIRKGSKYFILTAVVIEKSIDIETSKKVDEIKKQLEMDIKTQLHWKKLRGIINKSYIMDMINSFDIKLINVIINTKSIKFIPSKNIYSYFSGYLYERICWLMEDMNGIANIFVSARGNLSKKKLKSYIEYNNNKKFFIKTDRIKEIYIYPNERIRLLQIADCCCSALYQALTYNNEMHYNYIKKIKDKIYCKYGKYLSYGLKIVPPNSNSIELTMLIDFITK